MICLDCYECAHWHGDWSGETLRLTQEQHEALTPIQIQRSKAIAKAKEVL